jgi:hypothetical protein
MHALSPYDLLPLEQYARERADFRTRVLAHKRDRKVRIGEHVTLLFEDRLTIQYQIQEMLRVERIFEAAGIAEELDSYNPLIPDGTNLKATMLIEYPDAEERARRLVELHGIEHRIALQVGELGATTAVADEDMERSTGDKTSAVHFLRFDLGSEQAAALTRGEPAQIVIDHPRYAERAELRMATRRALAADLD